MNSKNQDRPGDVKRGQAVLEMLFVLPFILVLIMVVAEFGIYFYRCNVLENTAQTAGRLAARGATKTEIQTYLTQQISTFSPSLTVANNSGVTITSWSPDTSIQLTITATVTPVMNIAPLNIFGNSATLFPSSFTLKSVKTVFVE